MTEPGPFRMSQGYDVLQPKTGRAYPVPCDEWDFLKRKLGQVSTSPWLYHTIGSLLGGAAISTLVTILFGTFPPASSSPAIIVAWAVVAVCGICAVVCFFFADQQRKVQVVQVSDVVTQMELIERRYEAVGQSSDATSSQVVKIISARYGSPDKYIDVSSVLTQRISASGLTVIADNKLGGDPCPGVVKEMIVEYEYRGQRWTKNVKENEDLKLP
ncbi:MAG: DUF3395 domain-containing protein [Candidatus Omnitrophica bacterium]|nr:DUF3395 domain-containing protein [Candidatus Omnitrophota bacterium]